MEQLRWEGAFGAHLDQTPAKAGPPVVRSMSRYLLHVSKDGDCTSPLGLCQCLATFTPHPALMVSETSPPCFSTCGLLSCPVRAPGIEPGPILCAPLAPILTNPGQLSRSPIPPQPGHPNAASGRSGADQGRPQRCPALPQPPLASPGGTERSDGPQAGPSRHRPGPPPPRRPLGPGAPAWGRGCKQSAAAAAQQAREPRGNAARPLPECPSPLSRPAALPVPVARPPRAARRQPRPSPPRPAPPRHRPGTACPALPPLLGNPCPNEKMSHRITESIRLENSSETIRPTRDPTPPRRETGPAFP